MATRTCEWPSFNPPPWFENLGISSEIQERCLRALRVRRKALANVLFAAVFIAFLSLLNYVSMCPDEPKARVRDSNRSSAIPFKGYPRLGYSIWGVQPGDDLEGLLRGLPEGVEIAIEDSQVGDVFRKIRIKLGSQSLTVMTQLLKGKESIIRLGVFGVNASFSLERNGKAILSGIQNHLIA